MAPIGEPSRKVEPFKLGKECGTVNDGGNIAAKSHGVQTAVPRRSAVAGCPNSFRCLLMKNVYEVLRQKELEKSRLETEVEALRVAASLLLAAGEAEDCSPPTSPSSPVQELIENLKAVNHAPQQTRTAAWGDRAKHWLSRWAA